MKRRRDCSRSIADTGRGHCCRLRTRGVSAASFKELLGTRQGFMFHTGMNQVIPRDADLEDSRGKRLAAPECGAFADLARPARAEQKVQ